jgi:hypothetical protein
MPTYNIVCKTNGDKIYLWNGTGFDHLNAKGKEFLYFSGKSIKKGDLSEEVAKCKLAVKQIFRDDSNPKIEPVEVAVSV